MSHAQTKRFGADSLRVASTFVFLAVRISDFRSMNSARHDMKPIVAVCSLWVYRVEKEHAEHIEHIKAEHGGESPAIPEYEFLNRRGMYKLILHELDSDPR